MGLVNVEGVLRELEDAMRKCVANQDPDREYDDVWNVPSAEMSRWMRTLHTCHKSLEADRVIEAGGRV